MVPGIVTANIPYPAAMEKECEKVKRNLHAPRSTPHLGVIFFGIFFKLIRLYWGRLNLVSQTVLCLLSIFTGLCLSLSLSLSLVNQCWVRRKTARTSGFSFLIAGIVVVFDFDKTIIDCDSDSWLVDELGLTEKFNRLLPTMPWNSLMDTLMGELHSEGKTIAEIADCLRRAPLHPQIISAIKSAYCLGCDLRIVSDANSFFIETILQHHGLLHYFSEINTNPAFVDENGRLRIKPYHDFNSSPHGCNLCPPNMCKGSIIERIQKSILAENKGFIYLGDGLGDFCPALKLGERDKVMPRKNFPLWELICKNRLLLRGEIHEWSNGEELERVLLQLITSSTGIEENSSFSNLIVDCKAQSLPILPHEALSQALPVPH